MGALPGRNEPCHCGSGRKYKQCCLDKDEAAARAGRAKEAAASESSQPAESDRGAVPHPARPQTHQPWKRSAQQTRGHQRHTAPRKVGGS